MDVEAGSFNSTCGAYMKSQDWLNYWWQLIGRLWQSVHQTALIGLWIWGKSKVFRERFPPSMVGDSMGSFQTSIFTKFDCTIIEHGCPIKGFFSLRPQLDEIWVNPITKCSCFLSLRRLDVHFIFVFLFRSQEWRISWIQLLFMTHGLKLVSLPQTLSVDRI